MANRSYLFSLTHSPDAYDDRPETISGLSEWPYDVPFMYRLLMSGDPQLCASLLSDGLDDDDPDDETVLHAISSPFDPGLARVKRFIEVVRHLAVQAPLPEPPPVAAPPSSGWLDRLKRLVSQAPQPVPVAPTATPAGPEHLSEWLDETVTFLEAHRNRYLLLETVEIDLMSTDDEAALKAAVEQEIELCRGAGVAVDALSADIDEAARQLRHAATHVCQAPWDAFFGLRFDDQCDSTRNGDTDHPLGLQWFDVLYFAPQDRASFDATD